MGGTGSGRWRNHRKRTVEECFFVDIDELCRDGLDQRGEASVFVKSNSGLRKKQVASVGYRFGVNAKGDYVLELHYSIEREGKRENVVEAIPLQTTSPHFGGLRWWFTCPLVVNGTACLRRVGKLYMPPDCLYFGCRHCYELTYRSCQESHKGDRFYRLIASRIPGATPHQVKRALLRLRR